MGKLRKGGIQQLAEGHVTSKRQSWIQPQEASF